MNTADYAIPQLTSRPTSGDFDRAVEGPAAPWDRQGEWRLLDRYEEAELIRRAQSGDRQALERLIETNIRLVYSLARRYRCRSYSQEDLVQEGIIGLVQAVERFDEARGCRLSTYAMHWIRQGIARAVEQNDRLIHVPIQASAEMRRVQKLRDQLTRRLGREPSDPELAEATGIPEERLAQLLGTVQETISLEALVGQDHESSLLDLAEDPSAKNPEEDALALAYHNSLRELVQTLRPREREVLEERFGFGGRNPTTLDELSRRMRMSREGVRQIEARAIQKLRRAIRAAQWD